MPRPAEPRPAEPRPAEPRRADRPNVLILYTDQQRWDSLGCNGNALARTPNLDRLAARGAAFDHCHVQAPVSAPSRMSFLTGRYPSSLGVGQNGTSFPAADATPVHELLRPYGYRSANLGKLHFTPHARRDHRDPPPAFGFDTFVLSDQPGSYDDAYLAWVRAIEPSQVDAARLPVHEVPQKYGHRSHKPPRDEYDPAPCEVDADLTHTAFVASETCRFLDEHGAGGGPFFAVAGFFFPHAPLVPPQEYVDRFDPADFPLPRVGPGESVVPHAADWPAERWRKIGAYYAALCAEVDDAVGRILAELDALGLADDTIVVFTSDHGDYLGDHGRLAKGMPGHDCITRVPLVVRYPGRVPAGRRVAGLVEAVDVSATILDYCGVERPAFVQGRSLRPLLEGATDAGRDDVLTELFDPAGPSEACLRTASHKYYCHSGGREMLWDLSADPDEFHDVSADPAHAAALSDLRGRTARRVMGAARSFRDREAEW